MDSVIAQLQRQARIRYLPLKPFHDQEVHRLLDDACSINVLGSRFANVIDHLVNSDREMGAGIFGSAFFRMIRKCDRFPLRIESYAGLTQRREGAIALRGLGYRVMGQSFRGQHLNFAHMKMSLTTPDHRLVKRMELSPYDWRDLGTRDSAIAIVPADGPLNIAHSDGDDLLSSESAAIIMTGARLMVRGSGFFVFHPLGMQA